MRIVIPAEYQAPFSFWPDPIFRRALSASGSLGLLILVIILLAPCLLYTSPSPRD